MTRDRTKLSIHFHYSRLLHQATALGYATVPLSFQLADSKVFTDSDQFLQWFCAIVALELGLPDPFV